MLYSNIRAGFEGLTHHRFDPRAIFIYEGESGGAYIFRSFTRHLIGEFDHLHKLHIHIQMQ